MGSESSRRRTPSSMAGAVRAGVLAGVLVVFVVGGVVAYLKFSGQRLPFEPQRDVERVLVVVALPDENGEVVAQVIAEADLSQSTVTSIDPSMTVTIPGTSYSALRDAYPFQGAEGVAGALAKARGEEAAYWIDFGPSAVDRLFAAGKTVRVRLPEPMSVFDGERLYEFAAGWVTISSVSELRAMLNGGAYLSASARQSVLRQLADEAVLWVTDYPGGLRQALDSGEVESDLSPEELDSVSRRAAGMVAQ